MRQRMDRREFLMAAAAGATTAWVLGRGPAWAAAAPKSAAPPALAPALFRGLHLRGMDVRGYRKMTEVDYQKMAGWGVNSVRLQVHADPSGPRRKQDGVIVSESPLSFSEEAFADLQRNLDWARKHNIVVVICVQETPGKRSGKLWQDYKYWEILTSMWREIAKRFGSHPAVVGYDLLNEPNAAGATGEEGIDVPPPEKFNVPANWRNTPRDYDMLMQRLTKAIREIDPRTTIIVEGGYFGGMAINFRWLQPTGDPNTIYSFHMYMPHEFNDQGGKPERPLGVNYPSPKFGKNEMYESMKVVEDFAKKYNVGIYVGEFGPTRMAEPYGAVQYLKDLLDYFEKHGWHTAYQIYGNAPRSLELGTDPQSNTPVPGGTPRLAVMKEHWALNATKGN